MLPELLNLKQLGIYLFGGASPNTVKSFVQNAHRFPEKVNGYWIKKQVDEWLRTYREPLHENSADRIMSEIEGMLK